MIKIQIHTQMSYLYSKVIVSSYVLGEEVKDSWEEVPIAIHIPSIMAFYRRIEEPGEFGKCQQRHSTVIMKEGTEYYLPFTFEELKSLIDPQGNGGNFVTNFTPSSPTVLTPSI